MDENTEEEIAIDPGPSGIPTALEENPFSRSGKTGRSPAKRTGTGDDVGVLLSRNALSPLFDKPKSASCMDLSIVESDLITEQKPKSSLHVLERVISKLQKHIKGQTNVKREIRHAMQDVIKTFNAYRTECERRATIETKIRTNEDHSWHEGMSANMTEAQIEAQLRKPWPETEYMNTTFEPPGDKHKMSSMIIFPRSFRTDPNFIELARQLPVLNTISEEKLMLQHQLRIVRNENVDIPGITTENTTRTHIIKTAILSEEPVIATMDLIKWSECVKEEVTPGESLHLDLSLPRGTDVLRARKILECCLFGTSIKVSLKQKNKQKPGNASNGTSAMIIKVGENKSFSEVVKEMKRDIAPEKLGIEIRSIKSTQTGDVHIKFSEKQAGAKKTLTDTIGKMTSVKTVSTLEKWKGILIQDIEEDVEKSEIQDTIAKLHGTALEDIRLLEFRHSKWGTKMITAYLPPRTADSLLSAGRIKLGWSLCKIREKFDPHQCNKCRRFGHLARECTATESLPRICLRCGSKDHTARGCTAAEYCFVCNETGHRANSLRCDAYRTLVDGMRSKRPDGPH